MNITRRLFAVGSAIALLAGSAGAQDAEATHDALRALKADVEAAFNEMGASARREDFEKILQFVHDDVVLSAMNGECSVGKAGLIEYFERHMVDEGHSVRSIHHTFEVDALTLLHGEDTGISYGSSHGTYELTDGPSFEVDTRWTCTMVREEGRWLIASFQFGVDIFDNPVLALSQTWLWRSAVIAGVLGLALGFGVFKVLGTRP